MTSSSKGNGKDLEALERRLEKLEQDHIVKLEHALYEHRMNTIRKTKTTFD
jgi:hypothetical protein